MGFSVSNSVLKSGNMFGEAASALQKSIRRGLEYESLFHFWDLAESGYDLYSWKRLCICAVEDIGLANPNIVVQVNALAEMWERLRRKEKDDKTGETVILLPEKNIAALAIILMCRSPKNRQADDLAWLMECDWKAGKIVPIPEWAINGHTQAGKTRLRHQAKEQGREFMDVWNHEFYEGAARTNLPVEVDLGPTGINWMKEMAELRAGCDYSLYTKSISLDGPAPITAAEEKPKHQMTIFKGGQE